MHTTARARARDVAGYHSRLHKHGHDRRRVRRAGNYPSNTGANQKPPHILFSSIQGKMLSGSQQENQQRERERSLAIQVLRYFHAFATIR